MFTVKAPLDRVLTIIILTSDHGEMLGDHYRFRKSVAYEGAAALLWGVSGG